MYVCMYVKGGVSVQEGSEKESTLRDIQFVLTSKIVEIISRFFLSYLCVQSFVINVHLYHPFSNNLKETKSIIVAKIK